MLQIWIRVFEKLDKQTFLCGQHNPLDFQAEGAAWWPEEEESLHGVQRLHHRAHQEDELDTYPESNSFSFSNAISLF
uniref:Uncharacterized protein n=1 Tax=Arundo donax TaxID=35708 RepID=A0A0A8Y0M3_ARUDO